MTGGLLQMVISGKQDIYLTVDPQITFFKKVYRRHTNFSTELIEIMPEQPVSFDSNITFILNQGDIIHRCYFEITLPTYSFSDQYITNDNYINKKNLDIATLNTQYVIAGEQYVNIKGFVDVELILYRILYNYLQTENVTINDLKDQVIRFNYKYKLTKDLYKNKIDESIYIKINMSGYISQLYKLITNAATYNTTKFMSRLEILDNLKIQYNYMIYYLNYYNNIKNSISAEIVDKTQSNQIKFNFADYLGHNFFDKVSVEIGGQEFDSYTKDILHINQMHSVLPDQMENYLQMIGSTRELNTYNYLPKGNRKILVPLIFWFNKNAGGGLPLVSMQYSSVVINAKVSDVSNIVCFENYEQNFNDIVHIEQPNVTGFILNNNIFYSNYTFNADADSISYLCVLINDELLKLKFPDLSEAEIEIILENNAIHLTLNQITKLTKPSLSDDEILLLNGANGTQLHYVINKNKWIRFLIDIKNPIYSSFIYKIASYYPYVNFNLYTSLVAVPDIKLICESVFIDDVERAKFAGSNLEYVVERYVEDVFTIKNKNFFDCEISFTNPCKELLWYIQPNLFIDGVSEFNQNKSLEFNISQYYNINIISKQKIVLNQQDLLLSKIDDNYYTYLLSYKHLNNILPNGIYYHSFCLYPEEIQPSGTANFRVIKGKQYIVTFNIDFLTEYYNQLNTIYTSHATIDNKSALTLKIIGKIYDLFVVSKGKANLIFN